MYFLTVHINMTDKWYLHHLILILIKYDKKGYESGKF